MIESGVRGYEVSLWFGVLAPRGSTNLLRGTPRAIIKPLNAEANRALALPELP